LSHPFIYGKMTVDFQKRMICRVPAVFRMKGTSVPAEPAAGWIPRPR